MRGLFTVAPFPDERGMAGRPWLAASYILPLSRLVSQITMQMIHSVLLLFDFPLPLFGNLRGIFLDDDEKLVSLLSSSLIQHCPISSQVLRNENVDSGQFGLT